MHTNKGDRGSVIGRGVAALLAVGLLAGCAHVSKTSALMRETPQMQAPPSGKALVCFHRPKHSAGWAIYQGLWDGREFIGDIGAGQSMAYVCEPGRHLFVGRSPEISSVTQADLLPGKIYDLSIDLGGAFIASFTLEPIKAGDRKRGKVAKWSAENRWVTASGARPKNYDEAVVEVERCMKDFVDGAKRNRLRILSPADHR